MENEQKRTIDKQTRDKISFISFIVPSFAEAYKMNVQQAYLYLKIWSLGLSQQTLVGFAYR
ncbi:MAG: hypothetical protein U0T31_03770 [Chitinophagales bacterium]|nr:hypothetical protein [Chitinophagales bacterium]